MFVFLCHFNDKFLLKLLARWLFSLGFADFQCFEEPLLMLCDFNLIPAIVNDNK